MEKITVEFSDGSKKDYSKGVCPLDLLKELGKEVVTKAVVARIDGQLIDLTRPLEKNVRLEIVTYDQPEGLEVYWHSTSHIMAHAIKTIFPEARLGIGPATDAGFYYDIDLQRALTPEDLEKIEKKMREIIEANLPFVREEISKPKAIQLFKERKEDYKLQLLEEIDGVISIYREGDFVDLCQGPHVSSTGQIKSFKLLSIAGAYWKGDERNAMLQRIYGISFPEAETLQQYLERLEEAKRRDHRKLGKELDLYSIDENVGPGLILWHPKGALIRKIIEDFWREEHLKAGYELLYTPHIARLNLWDKSGHLEFFKENMFSPMNIDEIDYQLKPMNCPFHLLIYKSQIRSYRDLPIRWAELGTVYRYERSGVLHGLLRVRGFTQDDAHIFCRPDQLQEEIIKLLDFTFFMLGTFGFQEYDVFLSTRPQKFVGTIENWELATEMLQKSLEKRKVAYQVDPGEGVFYGPKIDIKIKDVLGRSWQCTTIQVDFNEPERFDLTYRSPSGSDHRPIMIHRALLGSLERFFGILIEHYAGAFPLWLAPIQVVVIPITDKQHQYAANVEALVRKAGIRSQLDDRNEKVGYKIREAELQKIPYMVIIGEKELQNQRVSIRKRKEGDLGESTLENFLQRVLSEINTRAPN